MLRLTCLALALAASAAFTAPGAARVIAPSQRTAAPAMQFFNPKKDAAKPKGGPKGSFYDDEYDSRGNKVWEPDFAENGERDLATDRFVDEHGHGVARLPSSEGGAGGMAACDELERAGGDLLARRRHSDNGELTPAAVRCLER